jgi:hypothetical protein
MIISHSSGWFREVPAWRLEWEEEDDFIHDVLMAVRSGLWE